MNDDCPPAIPGGDVVRLCAAIDAAQRVLAADLADVAARHDLTPSEVRLLTGLDPDHAVPFHHHARRLGLDPSSISLLARSLVTAELAVTRPDPDDGRRRHLHLTHHGVTTRSQLLAELADAPLVLDGLGAAELRRLADQVEALVPRDRPRRRA